MKQTIWTPQFIAKSAAMAAVYVVITGIFAPFGFQMVQIRIADALVILAFYTPAAVPGLTAGCFLANLLWSPFGFSDVVFGTLATFIGVLAAYALRKNRPLALMPNVVSNALLVSLVLTWAGEGAYLLTAFYIGVSQVIACYAIGWPLSTVLDKYATRFIKDGGTTQ
jgi:uncharacterized membrane protein